MNLDLVYTNNFKEAGKYRNKGYEPVECAFGEKGSVVGPLVLDHHCQYSSEEPVSLKSFKLVVEKGISCHKFVATGQADPDSIYSMLVLSGEIKPSLEISASIAQMDLDPIGLDRLTEPNIRVPAFEMLYTPGKSRRNHLDALDIGKLVFDSDPLGDEIKSRIPDFEERRNRLVEEEIIMNNEDVLFLETDLPHRDVAHKYAPLIIQYKPGLKIITFSGLSRIAAKKLHKVSVYDLFGPTGLNKIYSLVEPILGPGSGGREEIGGSHREREVSREEAIRVYWRTVEYKRRFNP